MKIYFLENNLRDMLGGRVANLLRAELAKKHTPTQVISYRNIATTMGRAAMYALQVHAHQDGIEDELGSLMMEWGYSRGESFWTKLLEHELTKFKLKAGEKCVHLITDIRDTEYSLVSGGGIIVSLNTPGVISLVYPGENVIHKAAALDNPVWANELVDDLCKLVGERL